MISEADYHRARRAIVDVQVALVDLRLHLTFKRMSDLGLDVRYRPNQPRAPSGTPIGGQWIDDPGVAQGRLHVAQSDEPPLQIDLEQEEKIGRAVTVSGTMSEEVATNFWP